MTGFAHIIFATFLFHDEQLFALDFAKGNAFDAGALNSRAADPDGVAVSGQKNFVKGNFGAGFNFQFRNLKLHAFFHAELLSAGFNDSVHLYSPN